MLETADKMQEIYRRTDERFEDVRIVYHFNKLKVFARRFRLEPKFEEITENIMSEDIDKLVSVVHYVEDKIVSHAAGNEFSSTYYNTSSIKFGIDEDGNTLNFEIHSETK